MTDIMTADGGAVQLSDGTILTQEQLSTVMKHLEYERIKDQVRGDIRKNDFNIGEILEEFYREMRERTRKTYEKPIRDFLNTGIHPLDVTRKFADSYVYGLKQTYAPNSVGTHVTALSSFYSKLKRWGYVDYNPFHGVNIGRLTRSNDLLVPEEIEVSHILDYMEAQIYSSSDDRHVRMYREAYAAVYMMAYIGLRIGALASLTIEGTVYCGHSKGRDIAGDFPYHVKTALESKGFDLSKPKPFRLMRVHRLEYALGKAIESLMSQNKVKEKYHPHSFRHFFAVHKYTESKDIFAVSKLLNHSSVVTTQRYLDSLGVIRSTKDSKA